MLHPFFHRALNLCAEHALSISKRVHVLTVTLLLVCMCCATAFAQDEKNSVQSRIESHIQVGEYARALELTNQFKDTFDADPIYAQIAGSQASYGGDGYSTAGWIDNAEYRNNVYQRMSNERPRGMRGGVTRADFDDLINLITETIDPDGWEQNGGVGRISPFPSGVYVDGTGALHRLKMTKLGNWNSARLKNLNNANNEVIGGDTDLRMVSLTRLERQLQTLAATGKHPTDEMRYLGGIYDLQYLMIDSDTREIVIAGPAGPWRESSEGRIVNVETGRPVLQLDDLVVALRNARQRGGKFYCSIEPRQENLKAAVELRDNTKLTGHRMREAFREALGMQDIVVEGIDARSHAAHVIVEADYRMKRVGFDLEPAVPGLQSYLDMVDLDDPDAQPSDDVVRWWFTTNYDSIETNTARDVFRLQGQGVKVLSESELLTETGERIHTGKSNKLAAAFARNFTEKFPEMAIEYPVYGELKNLFDLTLVAALIESEDVRSKVDVSLPFFNEPRSPGDFAYQLTLQTAPKTVESIMNHRILKKRVGSVTQMTTIFGVSGGVNFDSSKLVNRESIVLANPQSLPENRQVLADDTRDQWWWD